MCIFDTIGSLGSCPPAITRCNSATISEDMETTMNTVDTNLGARLAIMRAISFVGYKHDELAVKKFGFEENRRPKTAQELVDWIKAGDIILPDTEDENYDPRDLSYDKFLGIKFPPKVKKDWEGLEKARTEFAKERSALELEVQVLEPTEALKNFKKFESKFIH